MKVIKRDGRLVDFDGQKIIDAISKAGYVNKELKKEIAEYIEHLDQECIAIEQIQDIVVDKLMDNPLYRKVAIDYIEYRKLHTIARNDYKELMNVVAEKLGAKNVQNQNANVDEYSFGGRMGETNEAITKKYALEYIVSKKISENHKNNVVYIHDLGFYAVGNHNCLSIPFDMILAKGFNTRQTDVRPAKSVNTAFQLLAVVFQLQSLQQFGGVAATHLDWTMVPYVRWSFAKHYKDGMEFFKEAEYYIPSNVTEISIEDESYKKDECIYNYALKMTQKEIKQAVEGMYHNLNTLQSRSGNQLPFTSINYGTCTSLEGRMITKQLLETSLEGVGRLHKTSIFPCGIFQCKKGVNMEKGDPNYDLFRLALKSTSKRLYPNYVNTDWSAQKAWVKTDRDEKRQIIGELTQEEKFKLIDRLKANPELQEDLMLNIVDGDLVVDERVRNIEQLSTMGCRTANGADVNAKIAYKNNLDSVIKTGVLCDDFISAAQKDGRGNIAPSTIILPTLAMQADRDVDKFITLLNEKIDECKDGLLERFEYIASQSPKSAAFMYENHTMSGFDGKQIRTALRHGTLAVGMLGLAEALQLLIGRNQTTPEGMALAKYICQIYRDKCAEFKKQYNLNFGLYYTPAENLCYTAMSKFKEKYGIIPKVSDKEFFTNSIHVPVWEKLNPFEKIDIESELTGFSSAGCITYVELESTVKNNIDALETIVKYAMEKDIPYFAINVPNDLCTNCGYTDEINDACPMCGSTNIQRLRRVTGYLTGNYTTAFNKGKQQEVAMRVRHDRSVIE